MSNQQKYNVLVIDQFKKLISQIKRDLDSGINNKKTNSFRLQNLIRILKIIKSVPYNIKNSDDIKDLSGISKSTLLKIDEILSTGKLSEVRPEKVADENKYIKQLSKIIGVGRKTAAVWVKKYGIHNISDLVEAYAKGKINLSNTILMGIKYFNKYDKNIPREEIDITKMYLTKIAKSVDNQNVVKICGSYRRQKSISHDIDVLFFNRSIKTISDLENRENNMIEFIDYLKKIHFIVDDLTYKNYATRYMGFSRLSDEYPIRRLDIKYMPYNSYYPALMHFTGSNYFNIKMRKRAINMGFKLNEYGIYELTADNKYKRIEVNSEHDIFKILEMKYVAPKNR